MPFTAAHVVTKLGVANMAGRMISPPSSQLQYLGVGVGATNAARTAGVDDVALSSEVETPRGVMTASRVTVTSPNDTWQLVGGVTASAHRVIDEFMVFDAISSGNAGLSCTHAGQDLQIGDAISYTLQVKYQAG